MKTEKNILVAFLLNLSFAIFELVGGIFTGSVAIISDAIHDVGDAVSIGVSYLLEKKSKKAPDDNYTFGYVRYSVIGGFITVCILLVGSVAVIINAVEKFFDPAEINYDGMIIFAVFGAVVNLIAARVTHDGDSINQKAVNLHMLEDVLGWLVVLVGAVIMRFTDLWFIDPIMSIGVALFILINALKQLKEITDLFLEKTPHGLSVAEIKEHIMEIDGVEDVHHLHLWSVDGVTGCATMHIVTDSDPHEIKEKVREELAEHGICHSTLELERTDEPCPAPKCVPTHTAHHGHHHHHH